MKLYKPVRCLLRSHHNIMHADDVIHRAALFTNEVFKIKAYEGTPDIFIKIPGCRYYPNPKWFHNFNYSIEQYRGLDFTGDLLWRRCPHRDSSYHEGTVWSWLIGAYVDALVKVKVEKSKIKKVVDDFVYHLNEGCIGSVSEIFDAAPPHHPRGCVAQAWSVAEILRVTIEYQLYDVKSSVLELSKA